MTTLLIYLLLSLSVEATAAPSEPPVTGECRPASTATRGLLVSLAEFDDTESRYGLSLPMARVARVLTTGPDSDTCARISDLLDYRLSRTFSDGSQAYNATFFQAGDRYYAAVSLRQPETDDLVASGLSFVYVLDGNLEPFEVVAM